MADNQNLTEDKTKKDETMENEGKEGTKGGQASQDDNFDTDMGLTDDYDEAE